MNPETLYMLLLLAPVFLLSLTVHEFAHARTALAFGDPTAKMMGRVSLNPLVHLDPIGTIVLLVTRAFGWAKPVPVNPMNLSPRRLGEVMVSFAGPLSNFALAIAAGLLLRLLLRFGGSMNEDFVSVAGKFLFYTMAANVGLCVFNLIPLFPLDGHHIVREVLPPEKHAGFMRWQMQYGRMLLLGLIFVPLVIRHLTKQEVVSPVGFVYGHALHLLVRLLHIPFP